MHVSKIEFIFDKQVVRIISMDQFIDRPIATQAAFSIGFENMNDENYEMDHQQN